MRQFFERFSWVSLFLLLFRVVILVLVLWGLVNTLIIERPFTTEQILNLAIAGLTQGSIYALIALGYTLVYGILLMINFAHGEIFMAGAFTASFLATYLWSSGFMAQSPFLSIILLLLLAGGVSMGLAVLLERIAYRPLRNAPRLVPLITAIGASFFLQYTFRGLYGSSFRAYPDFSSLPLFTGTFNLGLLTVPRINVLVFSFALVLMIGLYWMVERTKIGKAMRAVSENKEVSRLMGIDVDYIIVFTFAIGGFLAGAAGVINGMYRPQGVSYTMGFFPGIKAFTSAVLGGIGSIPGAMLGGLLLGVFEALGPNLVLAGLGIPGANQLKDAIAFTLLVVILIFRPQGILGEKLAEKKA
ncbi:MAG: branched-chain amino acid ABC transporter permease [Chloroflexi bacterium]|nr:branched-chain amino acid ABC transporter permease [Chloroflexota bacterium]MDA0241860.1 branched-chain amino acid ABC transporter permease [Chloroflexota bacterium]